MEIPYNLAQIFPALIPTGALFASLLSQNIIGIFFVGLWIVSSLITELAKFVAPKLLSPEMTMRPHSSDGYCGIFRKCRIVGDPITRGSRGFPSGHAQYAMVFAVFCSLYVFMNNQNIWKYAVITVIAIIAFFVMYSRNKNGCHTGVQIGVGGILGIIVGIAGYMTYAYIWNESYTWQQISLISVGYLAAVIIMIGVLQFAH
jgi:membrane-associated phospholipid phosphatase